MTCHVGLSKRRQLHGHACRPLRWCTVAKLGRESDLRGPIAVACFLRRCGRQVVVFPRKADARRSISQGWRTYPFISLRLVRIAGGCARTRRLSLTPTQKTGVSWLVAHSKKLRRAVPAPDRYEHFDLVRDASRRPSAQSPAARWTKSGELR